MYASIVSEDTTLEAVSALFPDRPVECLITKDGDLLRIQPVGSGQVDRHDASERKKTETGHSAVPLLDSPEATHASDELNSCHLDTAQQDVTGPDETKDRVHGRRNVTDPISSARVGCGGTGNWRRVSEPDGACPRPHHSPASTGSPHPASAVPPVSVPPSSKSRTFATPDVTGPDETMPDETKHRADGAGPRPYHSPASTEFPEPAPAMPPVSVPPSSKSRTSATPGGKWDDVLYAYIFIVDTMRSLVLLSGKEGRERTSSSSYFDAGVDGTLLTGLVHAPGGLVPGGSTALDASLAVLRDQMNLVAFREDVFSCGVLQVTSLIEGKEPGDLTYIRNRKEAYFMVDRRCVGRSSRKRGGEQIGWSELACPTGSTTAYRWYSISDLPPTIADNDNGIVPVHYPLWVAHALRGGVVEGSVTCMVPGGVLNNNICLLPAVKSLTSMFADGRPSALKEKVSYHTAVSFPQTGKSQHRLAALEEDGLAACGWRGIWRNPISCWWGGWENATRGQCCLSSVLHCAGCHRLYSVWCPR